RRGLTALAGCLVALAACGAPSSAPDDDVTAGTPPAPSPAPAPAPQRPPLPTATPADPVTPPEPTFEHSISEITPELRAAMVPAVWREGCPTPLEDLRHLTMSHWDFEGEVR